MLSSVFIFGSWLVESSCSLLLPLHPLPEFLLAVRDFHVVFFLFDFTPLALLSSLPHPPMTVASSPTEFLEVEPVSCVPMSDDSYLTSWRVRLFDFWAMARLIVVDRQDLLTVLCVYLPLAHHVVPTLAV